MNISSCCTATVRITLIAQLQAFQPAVVCESVSSHLCSSAKALQAWAAATGCMPNTMGCSSNKNSKSITMSHASVGSGCELRGAQAETPVMVPFCAALSCNQHTCVRQRYCRVQQHLAPCAGVSARCCSSSGSSKPVRHMCTRWHVAEAVMYCASMCSARRRTLLWHCVDLGCAVLCCVCRTCCFRACVWPTPRDV